MSHTRENRLKSREFRRYTYTVAESTEGRHMQNTKRLTAWQTFDREGEPPVVALSVMVQGAVEDDDPTRVEYLTGISAEDVRFMDEAVMLCGDCDQLHDVVAIACTDPALLVSGIRLTLARWAYRALDINP